MTTAYPLSWPQGWPRTPSDKRDDSKYRFKRSFRGGMRPESAFWTFAEARNALYAELEKLGARNVVCDPVSLHIFAAGDGGAASGLSPRAMLHAKRVGEPSA